jgi:hypothetical protein
MLLLFLLLNRFSYNVETIQLKLQLLQCIFVYWLFIARARSQIMRDARYKIGVSLFYIEISNKADWYDFPYPTGRMLENERCVTTIEKGITIKGVKCLHLRLPIED